MAFVDYYGILNIARNATEAEINDAFFNLAQSVPPQDIFEQAMEAREILTNPADRKKYDKAYGYIMVIQTQAAALKNGQNYVLNKPIQSHISLLALKDDFQNWVVRKTGLDWDEAEQMGYSCEIYSDPDFPYLTLQFPNENFLNLYAQKLVGDRKIKK